MLFIMVVYGVIVASLLLTFSLSFTRSDSSWKNSTNDFSCPPNDSIRPCLCHTLQPIPAVQCNNVRSLGTVHQALENHFDDVTIPVLRILNCNFTELPPRAFLNLKMTRLHISNADFEVLAPDAFEGLDSLMSLALHNVMLFNFPTEALSKLPNLITLSLVKNKMTTIVQEHFQGIGTVKYLSLRENRIAHIDRASFPIGLVSLAVSNNHLNTLHMAIRHLPYLEALFAEENRLTNIEGELDGLYNLKSLYLSDNLLRTLGDSFRDLHKLSQLDLQYNSIEDLGESLYGLMSLRRLNLSHNYLFRINSNVFKDLTSLESLDLSHNNLIALDGALLPVVALERVDLSKNAFYNFTFQDIHTLANLEKLNLDDNYLSSLISGEEVSHFIPLRRLMLSKNNLDSLMDFMAHFPLLRSLDISYNLLLRIWKKNFEDMTYLEYINMQGNPLICDVHQMHVIHELETRHVEIEGAPSCSAPPIRL